MAKKGRKNLKSGSTPKEKKVTSKGVAKSATKAAAPKAAPSVERRVCPHIETGVNLEKLSQKFKELEPPIKCDDCREAGGRGSKVGKKGGAAIWMCLECGHFTCGGVGLPNTPGTHAARHAKAEKHPLTVRFENHQLRWCFQCDMVIRAEKSEDGVEEKDVFHEVVKLMKGKPDAAPVLDAEDIWFGRGSVLGENSPVVGAKGGYSVKGLSNLGNTCFFNSVMQNLLALSSLREYFRNLDPSFGPLSASLKKLVSEVEMEFGMRHVVSPKILFGAVCAKAPQFKGYLQQDSHELLRCLLEELSTEEVKVRKLDGSWKEDDKSNPVFVDAMFGGQLSSKTSCLDCKHSSLVYEPFLDLSLPVPTKKPSSGKKQNARVRKSKPPPKRIYQPRPKITSSSASVVSSCAIQSSVTGPEQSMVSSGNSADVVCSDTETLASRNSLVTETVPFAQQDESTQTLADNTSWLDVLDADPNEFSQMNPGFADSCGPVSEFDVPMQSDLEYSGGNVAMQMDALASSFEGTCLDEREQVRSINDEAIDSQVNEKLELNDHGVRDAFQSEAGLEFQRFPSSQDCYYGPHWPEKSTEEATPLLVQDSEDRSYGPHWPEKSEEETPLVVQDSGVSDAVQTEVEGLEYHSLHFSQDCSYGPHLPEKLLEEETPLLVQDSDVLLLPYTEGVATNSEVTKAEEFLLSIPDPECDSSGLDGLENLFNEPEDIGPSLNTLYISDSEPDEVDDSNAPVSVEGCLSLFTKAERLCKKEHAWECENCSKVLQQKLRLKKLQNSRSEHAANRDADTTSGFSHRTSSDSEAIPLCNGNVNLGSSTEDATSSMLDSNYRNCEGCDGGERRFGRFSDGSVQELAVQTENLSLESEGEEDHKKKEKIVKVQRDATKRLMLNKAPRILTIHLKRFSQDGRGRLSKLNGHVQFSSTLDLKPFMDKSCVDREDCKYRLTGLVEHSGTMKGGHYVSYVRGGTKTARGDDVWLYASDAHVRETTLPEVLRSEAYILFYERV